MNLYYFVRGFSGVWIVILLLISGCTEPTQTSLPPLLSPTPSQQPEATFTQTPTLMQTSTETAAPPSSETPSPSPPPTSTMTPLPTLDPTQAFLVIQEFLSQGMDCPAPCLWGIIPGQTTLGEALNIFTQLGLTILTNTEDNKTYYGVRYEFTNGLSLGVSPIVNNDLITSLVIDITPEEQNVGTPKGWITYSPETLINWYGPPDRVDFDVGYPRDPGPGPAAWYDMTMHFKEENLIILYALAKIASPIGELRICPITDQFGSVRVWFGENPENPPIGLVPLEEATSMTLEEFSTLMTGGSTKACFNLESGVFP